MEHLNGRESLWTAWCLVRSPFSPNDLEHVGHWCSRMPVWISWCFVRLPFCPNDLEHVGHWCALMPVCTSWCSLRALFCPNDLEHVGHLCALIPVCTVSRCVLRSNGRLKLLSHCWHLWFLARFWRRFSCCSSDALLELMVTTGSVFCWDSVEWKV